MALRQVKKRDGTWVPFDPGKIESAIQRAAFEVLRNEEGSKKIASSMADAVMKRMEVSFRNRIPGVEAIQDLVETVLMEEGYSHIARAYILYRERRSEIRMTKSALSVVDDLKLSIPAMEVLKRRYLLKDDQRKIIETPSELFRRVASHVAQGEDSFPSRGSLQEAEERFYHMMRNLEFIPNSPTLMNAGTSFGQLSACFVLPVEDSIEDIFKALRHMATIHQTGGGTGFSFSRLRPRGDLVSSTKGEASGPVSFMSVFDHATGVIVQGGRRRGANMGVLRCDHPDIVEFIESKLYGERFSNFNISVGITDRFMEAVVRNESYDLINPRTGRRKATLKAKPVFDLMANAAWHTGDPGVIFLDEINRKNPTPEIGEIETVNPCGELPLLPYESCNLASINLAKMVKGNRTDWERLKETIFWGVRFLDDVIEVNRFPLPEIREVTLGNRKIGLGLMGFADLLILLGIPYGSREALSFGSRLMRFFHEQSLNASHILAEQRGPFPNYERSVYFKKGLRLRNATVNTIAPTGTISIIAGCSSGIEPLFAVTFVRNVLSGTRLFEVHPIFEARARQRGFYSQDLMAEMTRNGSIQSLKRIPPDIRRVFVTAFDLRPEQHLRLQAAFQRHTDNSVSKTINLPPEATVDDVRRIYHQAYQLECKGITIYRYGTKKGQVLSFGSGQVPEGMEGSGPVVVDAEYSGGCLTGACPF
jgi:ribonucleoside-diphosphate reductase alpha chain